MLRFWAVVLASNILGAAIFVATETYGNQIDPAAFDLLSGEATYNLEPALWPLTLRAVFGGWLVALVAWLVAACKSTISQAFPSTSSLVPHPGCGAHALRRGLCGCPDRASLLGDGALGVLLAPATLGNAAGGVVLVTLLDLGQVVGSDKKHLPNADTDL